MGTITGKKTYVIRVADKNGNAATQELFFQIGSGKDAVTIKKVRRPGVPGAGTPLKQGDHIIPEIRNNREGLVGKGKGILVVFPTASGTEVDCGAELAVAFSGQGGGVL